MNLRDELRTAIYLTYEAGVEIMKIYDRQCEVMYKEDQSPVTEADLASNRIILDGLKKSFPEHAFLSEESEDDRTRLENEWCWLIDPLDGTREYLKRNGEFSINIALAYQKKVVLGVVYAPVQQELFFAVKGRGAYVVRNNQKAQPIQVSEREKNIRLVVGRSPKSKHVRTMAKLNQVNRIMEKGSSLKGCLIAEGKADIHYRYGPTMEWDTAAMQCIIEEAGGMIRNLDDTEIVYNREDSTNAKGFYILNRLQNKWKIV